MTTPKDDFLEEVTRAEDILLGGLGFGEEARIVTISLTGDRFFGTGCWSDGETFVFESEDELSELDRWAVEILKQAGRSHPS